MHPRVLRVITRLEKKADDTAAYLKNAAPKEVYNDNSDESSEPDIHERVVSMIEAAAGGDKELAGYQLNDLVHRERIGWSEELIRILDALEAAADGDKALVGHQLNDLVHRERIGWSNASDGSDGSDGSD